MHELLARLGPECAPGDMASRAGQLAAEAGWPAGDTAAIAALLQRQDVLALLGRGTMVHSEKEVVDRSGAAPQFRRLDRLQVGPDEALVIDFKTGMEKSAEHAAQVRAYAAAIAPLYPGRKCLGFLLYVDRQEIVEVACSS
jgi:ATP-dependent helicase/nuclease subunit A